MQRSVYESWLTGLDERGFDLSFISLLMANGFYDIHFTHGSFEFGKDFIAKRTEEGVAHQYTFQSKAGDIGGTEWGKMFSQLYEAIGGDLVHPNFEKAIPRICVLLTTGELVGKTAISANDFRRRNKSEGEFVVWDKNYLFDLIRGVNPKYPLYDLHPAIERLSAEIELGEIGTRELLLGLEKTIDSVPLTDETFLKVALGSSFILSQLKQKGLYFYRPLVASFVLRIAISRESAMNSDEFIEGAVDVFLFVVNELIRVVEPFIESPGNWMETLSGGMDGWIAYPSSCMLFAEFVSVAYLCNLDRDDQVSASEYLSILEKFLNAQPGVKHPVSDRYAMSVYSVSVALYRAERVEKLTAYLVSVGVWLFDLVERNGGVAGVYSTPRQEVENLLGSDFDFTDSPGNKDSFLAVILAEVTKVFTPQIHDDIVNDIKAVRLIPSGLVATSFPACLFLKFNGTASCLNYDYESSDGPCPWYEDECNVFPEWVRENAGLLLLLAVGCRDRVYQGCILGL